MSIATWPQISGSIGSPNPRADVEDVLGEHIADYDVDGLMHFWLDAVNMRIREGIDADLSLTLDGELIGPADWQGNREETIRLVAGALGEFDLGNMADRFDTTIGEVMVGLRPASDEAMRAGTLPDVYTYGPGMHLAAAIADARQTYSRETGLPNNQIYSEVIDVDAGNEHTADRPLTPAQEALADAYRLVHDLLDSKPADVDKDDVLAKRMSRTLDLLAAGLRDINIPSDEVLQRMDADSPGPRGFAPVNPTTGVTILGIDALTLPHRTAIDPQGTEFHINRLELDARHGTITIWMTELDEDGHLDTTENDEIGVDNLRGWAIL